MGAPGIRDVADLAGVSITTVSQVMNGKGSFHETTRARVLDAAASLGYQPHAAARSLAGMRTQVIGLAFSYSQAIPFPLTDVDYFARAIGAATEQALARQYSLVVGPPTPQSDVWFRLPLDGVVVFDPVAGDDVPHRLRHHGTPMVIVGRDPEGAEDDLRVGNDQRAAMRLALEHLREQGAARPAFLTYPLQDAYVADAEDAYRRWCRDHGLAPTVWSVDPSREQKINDEIGAALLAADGPDAVVSLEDDLAIAVATLAADRGLTVPEDVMVVAFGDRTVFPGVQITTVELNAAATARAAVDMLIDLIEKGVPAESSIEIPVRLVQRASTTR